MITKLLIDKIDYLKNRIRITIVLREINKVNLTKRLTRTIISQMKEQNLKYHGCPISSNQLSCKFLEAKKAYKMNHTATLSPKSASLT